MTDLLNPGPDDFREVRDVLSRAGYDVDAMSDEEAVAAMRELLQRAVPAPQIKAGSRPVNARVWLHEVLTSGGVREPEDKRQLARMDDGGEPIDLGILAILCMRHMSGGTPSGWTDEALSERTGMPLEDLRRGQKLLDEVAVLVGRPAEPAPRWWDNV